MQINWYQKEKEKIGTGKKTEIAGGENKTSSIGELLKKEQQVKAKFAGEILISNILSTLLALKV